MKLRWRLSLALLLSVPVMASAAVPKGMDLPACAARFAPEFGVDLKLIQAIRIAEGGTVGQSVCGNKNKTCDHGPMQINDGWFDGRWGVSLPKDFGVTKQAVLNDECQNIRVGMWVLRQAHQKLKDWPDAVAAYNAGLSRLENGRKYSDRVFRWYERLDGKSIQPRRQGLSVKNSAVTPPANQELRRLLRVSGA